MSRGPGWLQRAVLYEVWSARGETISRRELQRWFPGTDSSNLRRAVSGLLRRGLLEERISPLGGRYLDAIPVAPEVPEEVARAQEMLVETLKLYPNAWPDPGWYETGARRSLNRTQEHVER
jgi:hypothetical protein